MSLGPAFIARQGLAPLTNLVLRDNIPTADLAARVPTVALNAVSPSVEGREALNAILSGIHQRSGPGTQDALNEAPDDVAFGIHSFETATAGVGGLIDLKAQLDSVEGIDLFTRDPRRGGDRHMKILDGLGLFGKRNLGAQDALLQVLEDAGVPSDVVAREADGPGFEKILADFFTRDEKLSRRSGGRGGHRNLFDMLFGRGKPDMRARQTTPSLEEELAALLPLGGRNGLGAQADLTQLFAELGLDEQDLLLDEQSVDPAVKRSVGSLIWSMIGPLGGNGRNRQNRGLDVSALD